MAFAIASLFIIYNLFNNKINYVSISDYSIIIPNNYNNYIYKYLHNKKRLGTFNTEFINEDINNLYKDLLSNRTIRVNNNDYYFKKVLRESDLVVINVGMNVISAKYDKYNMEKNRDLFLKVYQNVEKLIIEIKKYAKGKIIFIGPCNPTNYYDANTDRFFYDINNKLNELMINNNVIYIELYELVKSNNNIQRKLANIIEFYLE